MAQPPHTPLVTEVSVAHSPDADDRFMFWPLREGYVGSSEFRFRFREAGTQALNEICSTGEADVCAISAIHYGRVGTTYQPLVMGCSVGDNYGPVLVAPRRLAQEWALRPGEDMCAETLLLTPGTQTTAHAVLRFLGFSFAQTETVPISPVSRVFEVLEARRASGTPTAALLIHEGRLVYGSHDCDKILDLGEAWYTQTGGGSLPLGMNVVRRAYPEATKRKLSNLLQASCTYAMEHRDEFLDVSANPASPYFTSLTRGELAHYLDLYANETTLRIKDSDKRSFEELLDRAHAVKWFGDTTRPNLDWV